MNINIFYIGMAKLMICDLIRDWRCFDERERECKRKNEGKMNVNVSMNVNAKGV